MPDLDLILQDLSEAGFVEKKCQQGLDRGDQGFPHEWQLLIVGKTHDGKPYSQELLYYSGKEHDPTQEFMEQFHNPAEEMMLAHPEMPFTRQTVHPKEGIHHDQRYALR